MRNRKKNINAKKCERKISDAYKYEKISRSASIKIEELNDSKSQRTLNKNLIWKLVIKTREIAVNSVVDLVWPLLEKYARKMLIFMFHHWNLSHVFDAFNAFQCDSLSFLWSSFVSLFIFFSLWRLFFPFLSVSLLLSFDMINLRFNRSWIKQKSNAQQRLICAVPMFPVKMEFYAEMHKSLIVFWQPG